MYLLGRTQRKLASTYGIIWAHNRYLFALVSFSSTVISLHSLIPKKVITARDNQIRFISRYLWCFLKLQYPFAQWHKEPSILHVAHYKIVAIILTTVVANVVALSSKLYPIYYQPNLKMKLLFISSLLVAATNAADVSMYILCSTIDGVCCWCIANQLFVYCKPIAMDLQIRYLF